MIKWSFHLENLRNINIRGVQMKRYESSYKQNLLKYKYASLGFIRHRPYDRLVNVRTKWFFPSQNLKFQEQRGVSLKTCTAWNLITPRCSSNVELLHKCIFKNLIFYFTNYFDSGMYFLSVTQTETRVKQ